MKKCTEFIARSFAVRTSAHLLHLSAPTYASHIALGEFYEALTDLVDSYAEIYMGMNAQITSFPGITPPKLEPVPLLESYLRLVLDEQKEDTESEAVKNVLAELEALTARSLYKLKFLK